mmetsp:Transcript_69335/g.137043  ORF Transcript_69335/g.137043 Transcript_69335/m.137043 type:complete len:128 (-) Transcript_69335:580-963(-)
MCREETGLTDGADFPAYERRAIVGGDLRRGNVPARLRLKHLEPDLHAGLETASAVLCNDKVFSRNVDLRSGWEWLRPFHHCVNIDKPIAGFVKPGYGSGKSEGAQCSIAFGGIFFGDNQRTTRPCNI